MEFERPIVIAISGPIASGKSSIATLLAQRLAWPCVSFGGFVRQTARARRLPESREILQPIGAELINSDPRTFCLGVLSQAKLKSSSSIVLDGVRHLEVIPMLRELTAPAEFVLVFVDTLPEVRRFRLRQRGPEDDTSIEHAEADSSPKSRVLRFSDGKLPERRFPARPYSNFSQGCCRYPNSESVQA
jgi:dephospho-CoA kinase